MGEGRKEGSEKHWRKILEMGVQWEWSPGRSTPKSTHPAPLLTWGFSLGLPPAWDRAPSHCLLVDQGSCSVFPPGHPLVDPGQRQLLPLISRSFVCYTCSLMLAPACLWVSNMFVFICVSENCSGVSCPSFYIPAKQQTVPALLAWETLAFR